MRYVTFAGPSRLAFSLSPNHCLGSRTDTAAVLYAAADGSRVQEGPGEVRAHHGHEAVVRRPNMLVKVYIVIREEFSWFAREA